MPKLSKEDQEWVDSTFRMFSVKPKPKKVRVWYRGRPWQWHVFNPLHGDGYRAFWFGPFKIAIRN